MWSRHNYKGALEGKVPSISALIAESNIILSGEVETYILLVAVAVLKGVELGSIGVVWCGFVEAALYGGLCGVLLFTFAKCRDNGEGVGGMKD